MTSIVRPKLNIIVNKNILEILKWHLRPTKDRNKNIRACISLSLRKSNAAMYGIAAAGTMLK